jgi:hypothetical protein
MKRGLAAALEAADSGPVRYTRYRAARTIQAFWRKNAGSKSPLQRCAARLRPGPPLSYAEQLLRDWRDVEPLSLSDRQPKLPEVVLEDA